MSYAIQKKQGDERNRLYADDLPIHAWYRFVLSFPPHLVRDYIEKFSITSDQTVLDPFCGTGTTLVEAKKLGITSVGIEANPVAHFAANIKTDWDIDPQGLEDYAKFIAREAQAILDAQGLDYGPLFQGETAETIPLKTLNPDQERLLIKDSISPLPLHKILTLLEVFDTYPDPRFVRHAKLALAKQAVYTISNLRFGPEIGVGGVKKDAPVITLWLQGVRDMAHDLKQFQGLSFGAATAYLGDARRATDLIQPKSIDVVITSPPYPNEKDYSRTTRLESVLLGFMSNSADLRQQKRQFVRSNTRGVYKDDSDDVWVTHLPRVQILADSIEQRRIELQKTSGFEKLYARVVKLYFGGLARHLEAMKPLLRPGAKLAYVVGDQASYFRIKIETGQILAEIAESLGYKVLDIDLFRTRFSTATKDYLREEVVLLCWKGK
jgi:DNA modification methylase